MVSEMTAKSEKRWKKKTDVEEILLLVVLVLLKGLTSDGRLNRISRFDLSLSIMLCLSVGFSFDCFLSFGHFWIRPLRLSGATVLVHAFSFGLHLFVYCVLIIKAV